MSLGRHRHDVPGRSDPRVDDGDVDGAERKVPERAGQPEARLGRPVHHDLVREIDDARVVEAGEDAPLHDPDERALVPEVGGDGDDPGGTVRVAHA